MIYGEQWKLFLSVEIEAPRKSVISLRLLLETIRVIILYLRADKHEFELFFRNAIESSFSHFLFSPIFSNENYTLSLFTFVFHHLAAITSPDVFTPCELKSIAINWMSLCLFTCVRVALCNLRQCRSKSIIHRWLAGWHLWIGSHSWGRGRCEEQWQGNAAICGWFWSLRALMS